MEWNRKLLEQTLFEIRGSERIPEATGMAQARLRIDNLAIQLFVVDTRLGWIGIGKSQQGLVYLQLPMESRERIEAVLKREFPRGVLKEDVPPELLVQLGGYADGRLKQFDLPIDLSRVKPFQQAVLTVTSKIPFGQTRSYSWVAHEIGHPSASRAVGNALATNPIPIIIPCHRVLTSSGGLGGYAGGLAMKQTLLRLEGALATTLC